MPTAGMPLRSPAADRVTALGSVPVLVKVGGGAPFAVTLKFPFVPTVKVVLFALVKAGGMPSSVTVGSAAPPGNWRSSVNTLAKLLPLTMP